MVSIYFFAFCILPKGRIQSPWNMLFKYIVVIIYLDSKVFKINIILMLYNSVLSVLPNTKISLLLLFIFSPLSLTLFR